MNKVFLIFTFVTTILSAPVSAEDLALARLFAQQSVDGTIVISSLNTGQTFVHNNSRANQRFSTASTFKILNTLIALEENAILGRTAVFKWGGHIYSVPNWNSDQTLESAFKVSCVWCYQELARQIGAEEYRKYLKIFDYGELREPFEETTFWLDGSLQISAAEQVEFLKKVYLRAPPFSTLTYATLRQIMLVEQAPTFVIWAKTGWAVTKEPQVGWYVGYVETESDAWFFATNIEVRNKKDLPLRQKLTRQALKEKGIIE